MRRPGVIASRRRTGRVVVVDGLPVLDPVASWLSLGPLMSEWDLTAVADRIISGTLTVPALASVAELHDGVRRAGAVSGIRVLRRAAVDARVGSWSRPESLLRILIARAGLPEPQLDTPIVLAGGTAIPDLAWPDFRIAVEYDGRWHDDPRRIDAELARHEQFVDAGWLIVRVRAPDLFVQPSALVARLIRRLTSRGYRARSISWSHMPRFEP